MSGAESIGTPDPAEGRTPTPVAEGRPKAGYIPTLDGWRAIAITFVLLSHGIPGGVLKDGLGLFGVRIFFGISGFLICTKLLEELALRGRIDLASFYVRRTFRIFPPLFAMMLAVLVMSWAGLFAIPPGQWLAGIAFLANYFPGPRQIGHLWSLAVEEHFYLIFPGLLAALGLARCLRLTILIAIAIALWRVGAMKLSFYEPSFWGMYIRTDFVADGLLWGCVAAILYASPTGRDRLRSALRPASWWPLCLATFAAGFLTEYAPGWKSYLGLLTFQAIAIPLVLVGTVLWNRGPAGRALEAGPLRQIGRLSYSIYLWQQIFLIHPPSSNAVLGFFQQFPFNLAAILGLSLASYHFLERPFIKIGHRLAGRLSATRREVPGPHPPGNLVASAMADPGPVDQLAGRHLD